MEKKTTTKKETKKDSQKGGQYFEAIGRRKTSTARVRITEAKSNSFIVNGKKLEEYFKINELREVATEAILKSKIESKFTVSALVKGGGISSQATAIRHGLSRALLKFDEGTKKELKKAGFLKRDPRMVERKKFGLKKARKAPQWSKR